MDEADGRVAPRRNRDELSTFRILPRPGPKLYTGIVWWAFGLYALFLARAPYTPTGAEEQAYSELMQQAIFSEDMRESQMEYQRAKQELDRVHVFGWRWREPYSHLVPPRQAAAAEAEARLRMALAERDALQSDAKAAVGIWSHYGVDEVRDRFWKSWQDGKDFAKRMSFWDVMFGIGGSRDEELAVTLMRWLGRIMLNFTIGLISALISFGFSLVSMIWEYKASYLSGILFFAVAFSGASAMVATFVGGMYATAAGGIYTLIQSSARNARLEGRQGARQQRMRYQQPPPGYGYRQPPPGHYQHYD